MRRRSDGALVQSASVPAVRTRVTTLAAWAIFAAYVIAARGIGNAFPLSVFDMYQGRGGDTAARVRVREADGSTRELDRYGALQCYPRLPMLTELRRSCGPEHQPLDYVTRDQQRWLEAHLVDTPQSREVAIVSRAWWLTPREHGPEFTDCVLARCTASDAP
ncbi:MAG: hypothetical protein K1X88_16255 [Nannocystaceae bacterium]|nr:hypothetical protein [Nannocystaceae bacterium]